MIVRSMAVTVGALLLSSLAYAQESGVDLSKAKLRTPSALTEQAPPTFKAKFDTSKGPFVVEVHRDWAPKGADRFYNLVKNGFFDDARFFRVVPDFMVQFRTSRRTVPTLTSPTTRSSRATSAATSPSRPADRTRGRRSSSSTSRTTPASIGRVSRRSAKSSPAWTSWTRSPRSTARSRIRAAFRLKETPISTRSSRSSITSRKRRSRNRHRRSYDRVIGDVDRQSPDHPIRRASD
jgi:Cyclophilin type peptidyl-prolyl cis-trans isomerase/CLD